MPLSRIEITGLRCLQAVDIGLSPSLNVVAGPNGSGKSSLLEAVYLLGMGRSFRSRHARDFIQRGQETVTVFGELGDTTGSMVHRIGVEHGKGGPRIHVDGAPAQSASVLARVLPVLLLTPETQRMVGDGARLRRGLLDWLLFHVEQGYLMAHRHYGACLKQRNAGLRGAPAGVLQAWDIQLVMAGETLHAIRWRHMSALLPELQDLVRELVGSRITLSYQAGWRGWKEGHGLQEALLDARDEDSRRGHTTVGPHRADLDIRVDGVPAQRMLSRGEGKLVVAALMLAAAMYVRRHAQVPPVLLIDDLPSELDRENHRQFRTALVHSALQCLVTTVDERLVRQDGFPEQALFHVEQGAIARVV